MITANKSLTNNEKQNFYFPHSFIILQRLLDSFWANHGPYGKIEKLERFLNLYV